MDTPNPDDEKYTTFADIDLASPPVTGCGMLPEPLDTADPVGLMRLAARMFRCVATLELADGTKFHPGAVPEMLDRAANALAVSRYPKPSRRARARLGLAEIARRFADIVEGQ